MVNYHLALNITSPIIELICSSIVPSMNACSLIVYVPGGICFGTFTGLETFQKPLCRGHLSSIFSALSQISKFWLRMVTYPHVTSTWANEPVSTTFVRYPETLTLNGAPLFMCQQQRIEIVEIFHLRGRWIGVQIELV